MSRGHKNSGENGICEEKLELQVNNTGDFLKVLQVKTYSLQILHK